MIETFFTAALMLFGLLFGSFANVVIWRVPRGESVVQPGSHCPGCNAPIAWYDNIPIVSWLVLRARCRSCGTRIAARYPAVEAASGALFALAALKFGVGAQAVLAAFFYWMLLVLTVIDLDHLRLPNPLVAWLAAIGAATALVSQFLGTALAPLVPLAGLGFLAQPLLFALAGVVLGAGLSGAIAAAYGALRGKSGLGMGDVKLLGALGMFLGPYVLFALFVGSTFGAIAGVLGARGGRLAEARIPFGPWLSLGALLTTLVGPSVVTWYLRTAGLA